VYNYPHNLGAAIAFAVLCNRAVGIWLIAGCWVTGYNELCSFWARVDNKEQSAMLIWRGRGIVIALIAFVCLIVVELATEAIMGMTPIIRKMDGLDLLHYGWPRA
jgi:hypothetical protein